MALPLSPKFRLAARVAAWSVLWFSGNLSSDAHAQRNSGPAGVGQASEELLSPEANEVTVDEHLGATLDSNLQFVDHEGKSASLGQFLDGNRPVLLTLNYYRCPGLCNIQLNALTETFKQMDWTAGDGNFRVVTVSIDPREKPKLAKAKRDTHLNSIGRGKEVDWQFLTGSAASIRMLAAQLGIGYAYDREQDQYAHPPVIMFLSPEGKIARYLYGLTYKPGDVKFALLEASEGRVGTTVDRLILSCFHYDASIGRYGPFAMGIMRISGVAMVIGLALGLFFAWTRERRKRYGELEART